MADYLKRIERMKERVTNTRPEVDLENARILTKSFQMTAGQPLVIQKAKAFRAQCLEKTVRIYDDELIVGCAGSKLRGGIICADTCWSILDDELETISERKYDPFYLTPEDKQMFLDEIKPYWKGRSTFEAWLEQIPEETKDLRDTGVIYINRKAVRGFGEVTAGYQQVINEGLEGIRKTILERKSKLDLTIPGDYEKSVYLQSLLITMEGIEILARRYAKEAAKMALAEKDPIRKHELETIAETCERVPKYPARNFREALQ